ncbi:hypothetical protein F4814DRAFT_458068 [Daldinia grandis]|nr:hypothetical protein F4814DRAFT_458068 [Daldinia grandis]
MESFVNNVNSLSMAILLSRLKSIQALLERLSGANSESEMMNLLEQVKDLIDITSTLDDLATRERRNPLLILQPLSESDQLHLCRICTETAVIMNEFIELLESLESILKESNHYESHLRGEKWYDETSQAWKLRTEVLRMLFSAITLLYHKNNTDENGNLSAETKTFAYRIDYQISLIESEIRRVDDHGSIRIRDAVKVVSDLKLHLPLYTNKHYILRGANSFYTGRRSQMDVLRGAFHDQTYSGQKRFVIYGLGGSGKTELTLKYAEMHRNDYWGVFFIDGSSRDRVFSSYAEIAAIGGVGPNEKAAKNWLTTRTLPWLLIIDNVDEEEVQLEDMVPPGEKGCILITSRNPAHKRYGTVGERYLELNPMEKNEANELILKAAEEPSPWSKAVVDCATTICHALGFLPLALVYAASAILEGISDWKGYLNTYDKYVNKIRRDYRHQNRSQSNSKSYLGKSMNVFSSYEILYHSLKRPEQEFQDAIDLLHVFSYFHFQNIRLDILENAASNPFKEERERKCEQKRDQSRIQTLPTPSRKTLSTLLREATFWLKREYFWTPIPLPAALRKLNSMSQAAFEGEVHIRLTKALGILTGRSLIIRQDRLEVGRYSMHPLVHKWLRERPEISISEQSLWCQVAATTLARSIPLPPLGETETERQMRRELLPHALHIRERREEIRGISLEYRDPRKSNWRIVDGDFSRVQADESGRLSRMYYDCGLYQEARELQSRTREWIIQQLGEDHQFSIRLTLFLSETLRSSAMIDEATKLQRRARQLCVASLGEDHPLTLEVTEILGMTLCFKGRWSEALGIHEKNVERLSDVYGIRHEKTLKAIRNCAAVDYRNMDYEKATRRLQMAWESMKELLGETDAETLWFLQDLATSYLRYDDEHSTKASPQQLIQSHDHLNFIAKQRRETLGREHPFTLLAILHLARLKSSLGKHEEAKKIMDENLKIAVRNHGEDHIAVIAAKTHYANILVELNQYEEADQIFNLVTQKARYKLFTDEDGDHPDRISAMWFQVKCLDKQGKSAGALRLCDGILTALGDVGGNRLGLNHKIVKMVERKKAELVQQISLVD